MSVLVPIGEGCVAWGMGRFLAELAWGPFTEPELEAFTRPELTTDAELEMGTNTELLEPNAFCAAVLCTSNNGFTTLANTFESCCGS